MKAPIYWIITPVKGKPAILPRPRGGDWLQDDVVAWRDSGISVVVSALTPQEIQDFDVVSEKRDLQALGIEFYEYPVEERGVPDSFAEADRIASTLKKHLEDGKNVGIHCRQGIGRSSVLATTILGEMKIAPREAFQRIQESRGCSVPDTLQQREWVEQFAEFLAQRRRAR
ncbi:MAG: dual specificity protein phosphatase family protein [Planctomycetes bacterium]|nr:dual specificity protein phosphatase family protein [Planctomycetota bacterium]